MKEKFPGGVWPVMLTPFTDNNEVDYGGLKELVEWYISKQVDGLFAVCQSSEMFQLSLEERVGIAKHVKEYVGNRIPVIASGHISENLDEQKKELCAMADTGIDALILITNRMAKQDESDEIWIENAEELLKAIPPHMKLGLYECPYPYKRVMTEKTIQWCVNTGRFYFIKDTSCDIENIKMKLTICADSCLKVYNANTATLLESLEAGSYGYSGVMANMHPELYTLLCKKFEMSDVTELSEFLTMTALIEHHCYPTCAKYYLQQEGLNIGLHCRVKEKHEFTDTFKKEILMLRHLTSIVNQKVEEKFR